jgi:hypothetical protein
MRRKNTSAAASECPRIKKNITDRNNLVGFGKYCLKAEWFLNTIFEYDC